VSRQVQDLLNWDLIEPPYDAWSSPVVLVCKKGWELEVFAWIIGN